MKTFKTIFFIFLLSNIIVVNAQTSDFFNYQTVVRDNVGDILANQNVSFRISILETTNTGTSVYTEDHSTTTTNLGLVNFQIGNGAIVSGTFNTIDWAADLHFLQIELDATGGTTYQLIGTSQLISVPYALHAKTASNVSGLESIDEGNGTGRRLINKPAANYDDIGLNAIDLSHSNTASTTYGASGSYSTALGRNTTASGNHATAIGYETIASGSYATTFGYFTNAIGNGSTAMGRSTEATSLYSTAIGWHNVGGGNPSSWILTDPLFEIGNSTSSSSPTNALMILKNGTITAPTFDISEITDDKALITKEYADTNYSDSGVAPTGLETLDEGNGFGWRLIGKDPNNYGNIGLDATDLSSSTAASITRGATGIQSTAMGENTTASGSNATAMGEFSTASGGNSVAMGFDTTASNFASTAIGRSTTASGSHSTAMGSFTTASGARSTSMGLDTDAESFTSTAMGRFNVGGGNATTWVETDPLFEIGNGPTSNNRTNALTVLKNGTITAPTFDISEITDAKALITKEYADANYTNTGIAPTGLETLDEGNGVGRRLTLTNPGKYGNIGYRARDLSFSETVSETNGATGAYSFAVGAEVTASGNFSSAMGTNTIASGDYSTAMGSQTESSGFASFASGNFTKAESFASTSFGRYNIGGGDPILIISTDPLFEIGNGTGNNNRSNAITVLRNGTITAPTFDISEITDDKALITKEYADANYDGVDPTGLEALDEGNGFGWRLVGQDVANYGNIGLGAVDLSRNTVSSATRGATGDGSIAMGQETTASSDGSTAMGILTIASSISSVAMGNRTTASGFISTAMGFNTKAESYTSTAIGRYNVGGGDPTSWVSTDPLFEIGNGSSTTSNNALTVLKNGNTGFRTATPNFEIHLKQSNVSAGGSNGMAFQNTGSDIWKIYHSGLHFSFAENGVRRAYVTASTGAYTVTSDRRLKKNITEVESVLSKINSLKVHRYLYNAQEVSAKQTIGFMAQDVQVEFPELVETGENGFLGLNYAGFSVIAIKAIQEQQNIIDAQQKTIDELLKRVLAIENKN
jgi:hypothetical protein